MDSAFLSKFLENFYFYKQIKSCREDLLDREIWSYVLIEVFDILCIGCVLYSEIVKASVADF